MAPRARKARLVLRARSVQKVRWDLKASKVWLALQVQQVRTALPALKARKG